MSKLIINNETVFVLHLRKYSETSVILDCFSQGYGRFPLLGKGLLRTSNKSRKEVPRLFQAYQINAILRQGLGTLTAFESEFLWEQPVGQKWFVANYLNEMLLKLLPQHERVPKLYQQYVSTLHCLTDTASYSYQLIIFEKTLLEALGYGVDMQYSARTHEKIEANHSYLFDPQFGFSECDADYNNAIDGQVITALENNDERYFSRDTNALQQAKRIIRMSLKHQLGDIDLSTVSVMREVDQFTEKQI